MKAYLETMPLKDKLITTGILTVVLPFFIVGLIIYFQLSRSLLTLSTQRAVDKAMDLSMLVNTTLRQEKRFLSAFAADPVIQKALFTNDYETVRQEVDGVYEQVGNESFTIFLTDKDGIVRVDALFHHPIGLDLSGRPYFKRAQQGQGSIVGPVIPKNPGVSKIKPVVLIVEPVLLDGQFTGIAAMVFNIDFFVDIISDKTQGKTGYAYMLNPEGLLIVHPRKELIFGVNVLTLPGMEAVRPFIETGDTGSASYTFEGHRKIAGLAQVELTGWIVAFTQDVSEIMAPLNRILMTVFISALVFLLLVVLLNITLFGRISQPITKMIEVMQHVTANSNEIIFHIGLDRKLQDANPAYANVALLNPFRLAGSDPNLNNTRQVPAEQIWHRLEAGTPWSGRIVFRQPNSDAFVFDAIVMPLKDAKGDIHSYLGIGRDISKELMVEKLLQQSQKLETIGTLASGIAHDFNNILTGIFGFVYLARMPGKSAEQKAHYIEQIARGAERARDLVSQILTFSREAKVKYLSLSPGPIISEVIKLLRASLPASIEIVSDIKSCGLILAEPTQIHQIVMNLFTNASHAIGDQPGKIHIEVLDIFFDAESAKKYPDIKKGAHIMMTVSDTGKGMAPDVLEHIFDPFFTTKSKGKGTGLGLSVVHGIIKKMNGSISATSSPGKGTTFYIIIPCTTRQKEPADSKKMLKAPQGESEHLAVVDDEPDIVSSLTDILSGLGYRVSDFTDSEKALGALKDQSRKIDLVITGYTMPKLSGLEIAAALKKEGLKIPVLMMSGHFDGDVHRRAKAVGIRELIAKPVDADALAGIIRNILERP